MLNKSLLGHASMLLANSFFGLMSPVTKVVLLGGIVTPLLVSELRVAGAMILFWLSSLMLPKEHVPHGDLLRLFFASLFAITFNQNVFIFGVGLTTPGDASILTTSMPLWAMLFAALILKDPITGKKVLGLTAGAAGALMLILSSESYSQSSAATGSIAGDVLVTCAQISFAFYVVRFKNLIQRYPLVTVMKWMFTFAFLCMTPFTYTRLMHTQWTALPSVHVWGLVYIVVVSTFLAYVLVVTGQKNLRPTVVAMYNYVQPVVACLVAIVLGLDSFNLIKGVAVVLIFGGVYMVTHSRTREEIEAYHRRQKELQAQQEQQED